MSETVKLIIEIPKWEYEQACKFKDRDFYAIKVKAIQNGIPLDNDSERAEVQAYFDGEAYGWEEGRKALIDDVKAEIKEKCDRIDDIVRANIYQYVPRREMQELLCEILASIGKAESEE